MSEEHYDERKRRADETGTCWLNDVFTLREVDNPIRLGPLGRTSYIEIIWMAIVFVISLAILYGMHVLLTSIHAPFGFTYSLITTFALPFLIAFQGRKLAHVSPLRKTTQEGMGTYIRLRLGALNDRFSWIGGKPTMYNLHETRAGSVDFKIRELPAIEWIGSQRAPKAPHALEAVQLPRAENDYAPPLARTADHVFYPRGHRTGVSFGGSSSNGIFGAPYVEQEFSYRDSEARERLMTERLSSVKGVETPSFGFEEGNLSQGSVRTLEKPKNKRLRRKSAKNTRRSRVGSNERSA